MAKANLLVTYDPTHLTKAREEVANLLNEFNEKGRFLKSEVEGILKLKIRNPKEFVRNLVDLCKKKPANFKNTYKWIPIDKWCRSEVGSMKRTIKKFVKDIKESESWKMDLGKRLYGKVDTTELIEELTKPVERMKVDLSNPNKIIKVEIIGKHAGIALLAKNEILRVAKK